MIMMDQNVNEEEIENTIDLFNEEFFALIFKQYLNQDCFLSNSILTTNLFEMVIEMVNFFTLNQDVKYYTVHLVNEFYKKHLDLVIKGKIIV